MKQLAVFYHIKNQNGTKFFREAVRGLIINNNQILLVKVKTKGIYVIPGGGINPGETMGQALKREIEEETGYIIEDEIKEYGYVLEYKEDYKKEFDNFIHKSYYFVGKIAKKGQLALEPHEQDDEYEAELVNIEDAIRVNQEYLKKKEDSIYLRRDILVLEKYLEETNEANYLRTLPKQIPFLAKDKFTPITGGWSSDLKYKVELRSDKYLLKLSPATQFNKKYELFTQIKEINKLDPHFQKALKMGLTLDQKYTFELFTWEEGDLAFDTIEKFSPSNQYQYGYQAGKLLKMMHSIKPSHEIDIFAEVKKKIKAKQELLPTCDFKVPYQQQMINYLEEYLLKKHDFESAFCHGDYHLGNMIISPDGDLKIIDFNRSAFEDPYADFNRMLVWSRKISEDFARGQIDGYFNGEEIPEDFWKRILFYGSIDMAYGILWALKFGDEEIKIYLKNNEMVLKDYNYYKNIIPEWYQKKERKC